MKVELGSRMTFAERVFIVRGFTPMSVDPQRIELEDAATGERMELSVQGAPEPSQPRPSLSDVSKGESW